jgi:cystathionine gamma-synthase
VILGSLTVKDPALHNRLQEARSLLGAIPGPFEAWMALRGIRTFPLRFRAAESNARALVEKLKGHSSVTKVRYPGFGAIISFEIDGDAAKTDLVCAATKLIANATSLGGVESTWERRRRWPAESESVPENLIRLSVGCEHVDDIWGDISTALKAI